MPCTKHTFRTVVNAYKDGKPSPDMFEGVEWRTEKVCERCEHTIDAETLEVKEK